MEMRVTDETETVREPAGDVCTAVVDDGQAHGGERRRSTCSVFLGAGGVGRDVVSGHVQQRRDAQLDETRPPRCVPAASEVQPRQQLDRIAALYHQTNAAQLLVIIIYSATQHPPVTDFSSTPPDNTYISR